MVVHSGIAIMARRWREPAKKIDRRRSNPSSSIGIKNYTRLKAGLLGQDSSDPALEILAEGFHDVR